jgi:hypothetical protein
LPILDLELSVEQNLSEMYVGVGSPFSGVNGAEDCVLPLKAKPWQAAMDVGVLIPRI